MKKLFFSIVVLLSAIPVVTCAQVDKTNSTTREYIYELVPEVPDVPKEPKQKKETVIKYQGEANFGFGFGEYDDGWKYNGSCTNIYLETVHGIRINQSFFVGLGFQWMYSIYGDDGWNDPHHCTFFLSAKGYHPVGKKDKTALFLGVDWGYPLYEYMYAALNLGVDYKKHWNVAAAAQYLTQQNQYSIGLRIGYRF